MRNLVWGAVVAAVAAVALMFAGGSSESDRNVPSGTHNVLSESICIGC